MQEKIRLRMVAKELNVSIQTIIDFLKSNDCKVPNNHNQLVDYKTYTLLKNEFYDSYVNHCLHLINYSRDLFIYSFDSEFRFTEDEAIRHKQDYENYNNLIIQFDSINKLNFPYRDLDKKELNLLKVKKLFDLKKIQFNLFKERNIIKNDLATNESNNTKFDSIIDDAQEYEHGIDDTDHEAIIMRSFYEGTQDNFGY